MLSQSSKTQIPAAEQGILDLFLTGNEAANSSQLTTENGNATASMPTDRLYTKDNNTIDMDQSVEEYREIQLRKVQSLIGDLPLTLQKVVHPFTSGEEILMALTASIAVSGSLMPNTWFNYDNRKTYPQLMLFISAPPSSGKGILQYIRKLVYPIQKEMLDNSNALMAQYRTDLKEYKRLRRSGDSVPVPTLPLTPILLVPGNITSAAFIQQLMMNGPGNPILIFELEADAFGIGAGKNEHGMLNSTILRSLFHNEEVSQLRKTDNEHLVAESPKGVVIFSGTASQIPQIFRSNKNGLLSRFLFFSVAGAEGWRKVLKEDDSFSYDAYFDGLASTFYEMWQYFRERAIRVRFSSAQSDLLNDFGERNYAKTYNFMSEYANSIPKRHANMVARIASVLTLVRYFENAEEGQGDRFCSDEDFNTSLELGNLSLCNALELFKNLPGETIQPVFLKKEKLWNRLPDKFSVLEIKPTVSELDIADRSMYRYLSDFAKTGLLKHIGMGQYEKVR